MAARFFRRSTTPAPSSSQNPAAPARSQSVLGYNPASGIVAPPRDYPKLPAYLLPVLEGPKIYGGNKTDRNAVWQHFEAFLASYGYKIAWNGDTSHSADHLKPTIAHPFNPRHNEAFAHATLGRKGVRWGGPSFWPSLCGAYDKYKRFVVIKIMRPNSREFLVMQFLASRSAERANHTIPVLQFLQTTEWAFAVMPSWELNLGGHPCYAPSEYLDCAIQCLQGLAFMHSVGIAHLDIYSSNIVLNHVSYCRADGNRPFLSTFDARFAFIDFEYARQFAPNAPRLVHAVKDTPLTYRDIPGVRADGYIEPFAADVYALARTLQQQIQDDKEFCEGFWGAVSPGEKLPRDVPEYIHLLRKMMDPVPERRPSATAALQYLMGVRDRLWK